jgi:hypothetical protein
VEVKALEEGSWAGEREANQVIRLFEAVRKIIICSFIPDMTGGERDKPVVKILWTIESVCHRLN